MSLTSIISLKAPNVKHIRRAAILTVVVGSAAYFAPITTLFFLVCGVIDVTRHKTINYELIEKYFMGAGIWTWLLSPFNLVADLLSPRNPGVHKLEDMPAEHRREIETCVNAFVANGGRIKAHVAKTMQQTKRCMLTFKWYNVSQDTELKIPEFEQEFRYIKTIAVSVFNMREVTSRHFGPMRWTFRVLYNLDPIDSRNVFIEVDHRVHYWKDNPLFIFDDTMFHQSINNEDHPRYCLFMDIIRPNYAQAVFNVAVHVTSIIAGSFKRMFYKNWSFIR